MNCHQNVTKKNILGTNGVLKSNLMRAMTKLICPFSARSIRQLNMVVLLLLLWQLGGRLACANPTGGIVAQGAASFSTSGSQMTINQTSANAYINWQSFNIGAGQTTTFVQPSSTSVAWNQINDVNPSQILGNLNANGYVVLQNQSGFVVGGQASITTHGLIMTTAPIPMPDLASGGAWSFSAPPPTAKIINYGQINVAGGGSAFLIASDIENHGTISAPGGKVGLYAGETVLVSTSPDGRGLSAAVTLPQGSIDNEGKLIADAGSIALQAKTVNQDGLIQANSVRNVNGTIELVASDTVALGAGSTISAQGDVQGTSSGGTVTIKSDNNFSDQAGSTISIAGGAQGGNGGRLEISALSLGGVKSQINGRGADGFSGGALTIDPTTITLDSAQETAYNTLITSSGLSQFTVLADDILISSSWTLPSILSQLNLQANDTITLSTLWSLAPASTPANLTLTAGNNIVFNNSLKAGNNWSVNLTAGTALASGSLPASGEDGIYLNGGSTLQTQNGSISLAAPNEVIVNSGAIRTLAGGSISVTTEYGDVNTGNDVQGYLFGQTAAPYYKVNTANLGGISTAAGGNVTIAAGGNVISFLPVQSDYANAKFDGGTGAFGSQPGNVTITAGGNIYGHYVLADGVGTISAGGNVGAPLSDPNNPNYTYKIADGFALSLINGSWSVFAPHGSIYVQDVRNPNGVFGEKNSGSSPDNYAGYHYFNYDPMAALLLDAGNSVEFIGDANNNLANVPNTPPSAAGTPIEALFPPSLNVIAGSGGFILDTTLILFPSPDQNLNITTLNGGNFGIPNSQNPYSSSASATLEMSASTSVRWIDDSSTFGISDPNNNLQAEQNNPNPVNISISGSINDVNLYTTKATQITVGRDLINSSFAGINLLPTDVTAINVVGNIYNSPLYSFAQLNSGITSANPAQPGAWDSVFYLAVDPAQVASLASFNANSLPNGVTVAEYLKSKGYLLFPGSAFNLTAYGSNPGFVYDPNSQQIGFLGQMSSLSAGQVAALEGGTFTVLVADARGNPIIDPSGHLQTISYNFSAAPVIATLYAESQNASSSITPGFGYQVGGPGQFNIHEASINLGNTDGIGSDGFSIAGLYGDGFNYATLQSELPKAAEGGASVNVSVDGSLSMATSAIYSRDGGNVSVAAGGEIDLSQGSFVFPTDNCYGIYTSGHSDVNVTANGNINIGSARIATFNGGNVFVESYDGDVNAGSGANLALIVYGVSGSSLPASVEFGDLTDAASLAADPAPYGSGVLAEYPTAKFQSPGGNGQPGNITILTPHGDIVSSLGGISQFALDQSIFGGPFVNLSAGTSGVNYSTMLVELSPGLYVNESGLYVNGVFVPEGNVLLGQGGVVGGTVNISALGAVQGLIVSHQDANISAQGSFNGTVLSGGSANFSGSGSVSGTVVGIGGINTGGAKTDGATLLSENVVGSGGVSQSTLAPATATTATQNAAAQSSDTAKQEVASSDDGSDDVNKKKKPALQHLKRVTVILPKAT